MFRVKADHCLNVSYHVKEESYIIKKKNNMNLSMINNVNVSD